MHDTRGHSWFVFFASSLPIIPVALLVFAAAQLVRSAPIAALLIATGLVMLLMTLAIVILSRLYQAFGDQLNQPAHGT
jgi:hypothetical protein